METVLQTSRALAAVPTREATVTKAMMMDFDMAFSPFHEGRLPPFSC
jgi:hypothetical protein